MEYGISFKLNESLYTKDPQQTDLGRKIIKQSILLIDEIGFEAFTFKKLSERIPCAEKSIYRYFCNKHLLLLFLASWYWEWVHFLIESNLVNITDPKEKLKLIVKNMVYATNENTKTEYIQENLLHKVVINEVSKTYHTTMVDDENEAGLFFAYKSLVQLISDVILEVNPKFPYPISLASNLFEMSNNQFYFAEHLPSLTDLKDDPELEDKLIEMMVFYLDKVLR